MLKSNLLKKLNIEGFSNFCIYPSKNNEYYGLMREMIYLKNNTYPEVENVLHFCIFDKDFNLINKEILKDISNRPLLQNYTKGIEDARLFDNSYFSCTTLDTNSSWKPEISLAKVDLLNYNILSVIPLRFNLNIIPKVEKNWVFLSRKSGDKMIFLYSCNPLTLVETDINTGLTKTIMQYQIPELKDLILHNGSLIKLDNGNYLVNVRKMTKQNYCVYDYSLFILFDSDFRFLKVSQPFHFKETINLEWTNDYEFCSSMFIKDENLYCCVSENEKNFLIYEFSLDSIF
jgi:hypothetical protein